VPVIRRFSFPDLNRILQIEHQAFPKSPYDWATFINLYYLHPENFLVYVETNQDQKKDEILGYIIFSQRGHIISVAVHPQHRRRGIGEKLLEMILKPPHPNKVWAEVRKSNQGARAFYANMGFQIKGIVPNYYGDEDALIVERISSDPND
jgi:ribosomal-protein-alanine N-acetyltransferase